LAKDVIFRRSSFSFHLDAYVHKQFATMIIGHLQHNFNSDLLGTKIPEQFQQTTNGTAVFIHTVKFYRASSHGDANLFRKNFWPLLRLNMTVFHCHIFCLLIDFG
jgi:hypothetical protein